MTDANRPHDPATTRTDADRHEATPGEGENQAGFIKPRPPGGTQAYEEASEGKRDPAATSNLQQAQAVGQPPAREGSRQGKDAGGDAPQRPAKR